MKYFLSVVYLFCSIALLASCGSSDTEVESFTPEKVQFTPGRIAYYDLYQVDTLKAGSNPEELIPDVNNTNVAELVYDTTTSLAGFNHITRMIFSGVPRDTNNYYQDNSGNLYRYNYGFSVLNKFEQITLYLGHGIDVGWVLVAKPGAPVGTTWTGKFDSTNSNTFGKLYLSDEATAMSDTLFTIGDTAIRTIHVRHNVRAYTDGIEGKLTLDTYISPQLGLTIMDFFHPATISGFISQHARGSRKILISYTR